VADHRRRAPDVGQTPHAGIGQHRPDQRRRHTLGGVTDEHRHRRPHAERLAGVPEAGIAVADVAQVDLGPSRGDEVGDRDRTDQVTDHDRDCHLGAHR
jgi:hypothetical protein